MNKIGNTIVENGINDFNNLKTRNTIRAVIIKDNKVLMLYSSLYDDYTFPGGGLKEDESHLDALKRELKEEVGANKVFNVKPLGYTKEIRYGITGSNSTYLQKSYYYTCDISNVEDPSFVGREKLQGLKSVYINPENIIKHNNLINEKRESKQNKGFQTVLIRENKILKHLLANNLINT